MYTKILLISAVVLAVSAQFNQNLPCGFTCSRNTQFLAQVDGSSGSVACSDGPIQTRCSGCCQARALQAGLSSDQASGFASSDNRACVCCFQNNRCSGGGPIPTFTQG
ncbi:unnamed protein product, partial [Mesorhabditis spiculigera]